MKLLDISAEFIILNLKTNTINRMAKRFTDTEKWKKPFIKNLKCCYKLLWLYICDDCDHAGVWQVDIDVARLRIGEEINEQDAIKFFEDKIQPFDNGTKWFIPSFIEFQYPSGLSDQNRAHVGILKTIQKYQLKLVGKPLTSPLQGAKEQEQDKDIEDYSKEQIESFKRFQDWIKENAPRVAKMKEPFTIKQYFSLDKEGYNGESIKNLLMNMHNYKPLDKNISAYRTLTNWHKREHNAK